MARFFLIAAAFVYSFSLFGQKVDVQQLKGMNIRNIGPAGMSGRVTSIDVDLSKPQHIYVGTASGGVWKSTSGGMTWDPIFDKQPLQSIGTCQRHRILMPCNKAVRFLSGADKAMPMEMVWI